MTSINTITNQSSSVKARGLVKINNSYVDFIDLQIDTTTYYLSDTFTLNLPIQGQKFPFNLDYWSSATVYATEIYIGFPTNSENFSASDLTLMFSGNADNMDMDPIRGTITITGRDYTSLLIDAKTTVKFPNKTASQIVTYFANLYGFTPVVTETFIPVGIYYSIAQTQMTKETSVWDLLTFLAHQSNFIIFVQGFNLIFKPYPADPQPPYLLPYQPPTTETGSPTIGTSNITFERAMTIANDVIVRVRVPYGTKNKKSFTVVATSHHTPRTFLRGLPQPTGKAEIYSLVIPGLSKEQAIQRAQATANSISIHEIKVRADLPGDNSLGKDSLIKVTGFGTALDQDYYTDSIVRTLNGDMNGGGYRMQLVGKNHSVDSTITV